MNHIFLSLLIALISFPALASQNADSKVIGELRDYRAHYEDTFVHLARDYDLGYVEMRAANPGVDPWVPGKGTALVLPTSHLLPDAPHEGIVINLPEMRLYAFPGEDKEPVTFPLGIGREGLETPLGQTTIVRKKKGPTWYPTQRMREEDPELESVVPPGPDNPLGTHALYLGWPQYLIHGTNRPFGIGRRISSGCIRMYPEDVIKFYEMIPTGTKVTVVNQPVKVAWIDDQLMVEAHPTVDQAIQVEEVGVIEYDTVPEDEVERIIKIAGAEHAQIDWALVRKVYGLRLGYPVPVLTKVEIEEEREDTMVEELLGPIFEGSEKEPEKAGPIDIAAAKKSAMKILNDIYEQEKPEEQTLVQNENQITIQRYTTLNP